MESKAFEQRREYLFIYSVKDANPNGDPLTANQPRMDESSEQILVSDVRVKRTIRDEFIREGKDVFVDGEPKTLDARVEELLGKYIMSDEALNGLYETFKGASGKAKKEKEIKARIRAQYALRHCIDIRLFGVTLAGNIRFSWTGPVQFKWGRSLHRAAVQMVQGTAAFAREEDSDQRSFRNEYIVPFALIADYAIANQHAAKTTGATDEDLEALFEALWKGTGNLITRSKVGHVPRFLMEVRYVKEFDGIIGAMDDKVKLLGKKKDKNEDKKGDVLSEDEQRALRSCGDAILDVAPLAKDFMRLATSIETVRVLKDTELEFRGLDEIKTALGGKLKLEER